MRLTRLLIAAAVLTATGCSTDSLGPPQPTADPASRPQATSVQLTGVVVLHAANDVRLLTAGDEIRLAGTTEEIAAFDGLLVVVSGRFLDQFTFWVETVTLAGNPHPGGEPD